MKAKRLMLGLVVLFLLWPASTVLADGPSFDYDGGEIIVGEDISLEPGETREGDLGIFDGDLVLPEGSTLDGDVFVVNGDAQVSGQVNGSLAVVNGDLILAEAGRVTGDVVGMRADQSVAGYVGGDLSAMFGDLELRSTAVVKGDLLVSPGDFEREPGAQIDGDQVHELSIPSIPLIAERLESVTSQMPTPPPSISQPETAGQRVGRFLGRVLAAMVMGVVFTGIGTLIVFIWPRATREVADCIAGLPVQSFGLGLLTYVIAAVLESLAAVVMILIVLLGAALIGTVILLPVGLLLIVLSGLILLPVPLVLAAAMILGWVSLAILIGERVLRALRIQKAAPLGAAIVGLLITVGITCLLWVFKPVCCAWPFVILLSSLGVGAAIHTRFGRKSCQAAKAETESDALPPEAMDEELGQPDGPMNTT